MSDDDAHTKSLFSIILPHRDRKRCGGGVTDDDDDGVFLKKGWSLEFEFFANTLFCQH